jgi:hypothetical protein
MSDIWVKVDVDFPDHPKILEVGPLVGWVYLSCLCWSRRYLTDGFISHAALSHCYGKIEHLCGPELGSLLPLATRLLETGLFSASEEGDGYWIHDYANHQQTKQTVANARERLSRIRAEAGRKGGLAKAASNPSKTKRRERERALNPQTPFQAKNPSPNGQVFTCTHCAGGLNFRTAQRLADHIHVVHPELEETSA